MQSRCFSLTGVVLLAALVAFMAGCGAESNRAASKAEPSADDTKPWTDNLTAPPEFSQPDALSPDATAGPSPEPATTAANPVVPITSQPAPTAAKQVPPTDSQPLLTVTPSSEPAPTDLASKPVVPMLVGPNGQLPGEDSPRKMTSSMAPRMAPATSEKPAAAPASEAMAPEEVAGTAPDSGLGAAMPATVPSAPEALEAQGYEVVKVFYGTDRAAVSKSPDALSRVPWMAATLCAGAVSFVLLVVFVRGGRTRTVKTLLVLAALGTAASGICWANLTVQPYAAEAILAYGSDRGTLEMGVCEVSIPKIHERGELEGPSVFRLEFSEDPTRHVVLLNITRQPQDEFYSDVKARIAKSRRGEAFVFVHGFNVTFEKAARRTAQLAYDLGFDGAPIFYSWPSQGGILNYAVDETNVVWTVPHLKSFLVSIARNTGAERIHLIAHSMGNRALTAALCQVVQEMGQEPGPLFDELILTAPDIDAEIFCRDIAPVITHSAQRVTLYASSNDEALVASKKLHGYPRAGDSGEGLVLVPGIDTIDVSDLDTSLLGHSYYGDSDTVLADLSELLHESRPPGLRSHLRAMVRGQLQYWVALAQHVGLRPAAATQ